MVMHPGLMIPRRRGPTPAEPSITVTTEGVDDVPGVNEQFTVSGGTDEVVTFSDGGVGGDVTFDAGGLTTAANAPSGYDQSGATGGASLSFAATSTGDKSDMAKTSGGGGDVTVDTQGADPITGSPEVVAISFGGATGGTIRINGSDPISWDATDGDLQTALEAVLGEFLSVTGSNGEFEVTFVANGNKADMTITENLLTK